MGASLYRGKYFEDVKCDWANLLRDQYDIRYASLRVALASYYASIGKYEESAQQASLALEVDQFCDSAWRILLHNYKEMADKTHYDTTIANRTPFTRAAAWLRRPWMYRVFPHKHKKARFRLFTDTVLF